jgi:hypothetical protein
MKAFSKTVIPSAARNLLLYCRISGVTLSVIWRFHFRKHGKSILKSRHSERSEDSAKNCHSERSEESAVVLPHQRRDVSVIWRFHFRSHGESILKSRHSDAWCVAVLTCKKGERFYGFLVAAGRYPGAGFFGRRCSVTLDCFPRSTHTFRCQSDSRPFEYARTS